jgi:hypothetical protein
MYGAGTLDEILFPMISFKSQVISQTLDASKSEYTIRKDPGESQRDSQVSGSGQECEYDEEDIIPGDDSECEEIFKEDVGFNKPPPPPSNTEK